MKVVSKGKLNYRRSTISNQSTLTISNQATHQQSAISNHQSQSPIVNPSIRNHQSAVD